MELFLICALQERLAEDALESGNETNVSPRMEEAGVALCPSLYRARKPRESSRKKKFVASWKTIGKLAGARG
jgi:hypothetical protein